MHRTEITWCLHLIPSRPPQDFAEAFGKLIANGAPTESRTKPSARDEASKEFREAAMHGSLDVVKAYAPKADVHALETFSGRSALHKAAFWGHDGTVEFLTKECGLDVNVQDSNGDTPLHDAARFGGKDSVVHYKCVELLVDAGTNLELRNRKGQTVLDVAKEYGKDTTVAFLHNRASAKHMKSKL